MTSPTLQVMDITKNYGGVQALRDVSVQFDAGRVHCLAGVNGSGKSTLIKVVSGVEKQDAGQVMVEGHELTGNNPRLALQHGIQVIYQDMALFGNLSAAENIDMLRRSISHTPWVNHRDSRSRAVALMERLGIHVDPRALVEDLPIADRQLVAICRALAQEAKVLFMDEPTTALTWREVNRLFEVVEKLKEDGVAIVFVSHKLDEVMEISDDVTVLRNGLKVAEGKAETFDADSLAEALVGSKTSTQRIVVTPPPSEVAALSVRDLHSDGQFDNITFEIAPGEILGLTGLRGSGRSQVAEALFGLLPVTRGEVKVNGTTVALHDPQAAIEAGIAYVPEDRLRQGVFLDRPIAQNLVSADVDAVATSGILNNRRMAEVVDHAVSSLAIKVGHTEDAVRTLSGGNQQKVVLGKWMATRPRVLILNGPTVGVDIGAKFGILQLLRDYAADGAAVLVVSDDFQEVVSVCHRILVVDKGLLAGELTGDDVTEDRVRDLVMEVSQA